MKKLLFLLLLTFLITGTVSPSSNAEVPGSTSDVITVKVNKAFIYTTSRFATSKNNYVTKGEEYPILLSTKNYYKVQLNDGKTGFIKKSNVTVEKKERIVMGWNAFGNTETYLKQNNVSSNLNVVSPRGFTITSTDPYVTTLIDPKFIESSHNAGKQVWLLFGNKFDTQLTNTILSDSTKRKKVVTTVSNALVRNDVDGINVDFENMDIRNKAHFVTFIRELKDELNPHDIILSVDVTRTNPDSFWSGSYDRNELGKAADYVVMMGYDEHWLGGNKAGSVASYPWVSEGLRLLIEDVPVHKIILGVPFYTREWVTNLTTKKVTGYDRSMVEVNSIIKAKSLKKVWDENARQNYVEYTENGEKHQIWIEDRSSMQERLDLVVDNNLGGVAAWRIGHETTDLWSVFDSF